VQICDGLLVAAAMALHFGRRVTLGSSRARFQSQRSKNHHHHNFV